MGCVEERTSIATPEPAPRRHTALRALALVVLLYVFLVGIRALGTGFKMLGEDAVQSVFTATANPFVALAIGILATTLVQSSSVTTSMVVALVAAPEDPLPIANAIPIIMGANIGTTVTNTVVSFGHATRPTEFRRAFAAAVCHDFFNWMAVLVLLPLELLTGFLEKISSAIAGTIPEGLGGKLPNPVKEAADFVVDPTKAALGDVLPEVASGVVMIVLAGAVIFFGLYGLVRNLRSMASGKIEKYVSRALDKRPLTAMTVGMVTTAMVQSSSITTSMLVPFAGTGIVKLKQVFPIALGANVGTTLTALIAAMGASAETLHLGVQIALVHLLFNVIGILMVYPIPAIRRIPLQLSRWLANRAMKSKVQALAYVALLFYGLPAVLAFWDVLWM